MIRAGIVLRSRFVRLSAELNGPGRFLRRFMPGPYTYRAAEYTINISGLNRLVVNATRRLWLAGHTRLYGPVHDRAPAAEKGGDGADASTLLQVQPCGLGPLVWP
jgi:hypothetical protein